MFCFSGRVVVVGIRRSRLIQVEVPDHGNSGFDKESSARVELRDNPVHHQLPKSW